MKRSSRWIVLLACAAVIVLPSAGSAGPSVYGHVEFRLDGGFIGRTRGKYVDRDGELHKREGIKLGSKKDGGTAEVEASPFIYEGGSVRMSFSLQHFDSKFTGQPYLTAGLGWDDKFDAVLIQRTNSGIQYSATNENGLVPGSTDTLAGEPGDLYRLDIDNMATAGGTQPQFKLYNERLKISGPIRIWDATDEIPADQPVQFRAAAVNVPKRDCVEIFRRRYDLGTPPQVQTQEDATRFKLGGAFTLAERAQKDAEDEKDDLPVRVQGYMQTTGDALDDADLLIRSQFNLTFKRKSPEEKLVADLAKAQAAATKLAALAGKAKPPKPKAVFRKARSLAKRTGKLLDAYLAIVEE